MITVALPATNLVIKAKTRNKPHADGSRKEMQSFDITFQVGYAKFAVVFCKYSDNSSV